MVPESAQVWDWKKKLNKHRNLNATMHQFAIHYFTQLSLAISR